MRRVGAALALVLAATLVAPSAEAAPSAAPRRSKVRTFVGTTSQGGQIDFSIIVLRSSATLKLNSWDIQPVMTCDDATVVSDHFYGYAYFPNPKLDGHRLRLVKDELGARYRLFGSFRHGRAEGTVAFRIAAFDAAGNPQVCSTGLIDWTADRL